MAENQVPANVLYLPPGVVPFNAANRAPAHPPGGPAFDREFFEKVLPGSIAAFCNQVVCDIPRVELLTVDGTTIYVNGISGVADDWVALHTARPEHEHPIQVFLPYQAIFRVEIHPESDGRRRRLGFMGQATPAPEHPALPALTAKAEPRPTAEKK